MPELELKNAKGDKVGKVSLPDEVFAAPVKRHLLHEAVRHYRAVARRGTHDTKNRSEVEGGGKKPWKQKHTGRARHGSTRSPLWRTGGTVHGPHPRSYDYHLPVEVRRGALRSALTMKAQGGRIVLLDSLDLPSPKTKDLAAVLEGKLGLSAKVLVAYDGESKNLALAARNNPQVKAVRALGINVYDLLSHDWLVLTRGAATAVSEVLTK